MANEGVDAGSPAFDRGPRDMRRAAADAAEMIDRRPDLLAALKRGGACLYQSKTIEAEAHYMEVAAIAPFSREAQLGVGRALMAQSRWGVAGQALMNAICLGALDKAVGDQLESCLKRLGGLGGVAFRAKAQAYWSDNADGGAQAPLLSFEIRTLSILVLGEELGGDETCLIQAAESDAAGVLSKLFAMDKFAQNNPSLLELLAETGWAA